MLQLYTKDGKEACKHGVYIVVRRVNVNNYQNPNKEEQLSERV